MFTVESIQPKQSACSTSCSYGMAARPLAVCATTRPTHRGRGRGWPPATTARPRGHVGGTPGSRTSRCRDAAKPSKGREASVRFRTRPSSSARRSFDAATSPLASPAFSHNIRRNMSTSGTISHTEGRNVAASRARGDEQAVDAGAHRRGEIVDRMDVEWFDRAEYGDLHRHVGEVRFGHRGQSGICERSATRVRHDVVDERTRRLQGADAAEQVAVASKRDERGPGFQQPRREISGAGRPCQVALESVAHRRSSCVDQRSLARPR